MEEEQIERVTGQDERKTERRCEFVSHKDRWSQKEGIDDEIKTQRGNRGIYITSISCLYIPIFKKTITS